MLVVANEDILRLVCKGGLRLQGRRYEVETYEEVRPDVGYGHCCEWSHIGLANIESAFRATSIVPSTYATGGGSGGSL